MWLCLRQVSFVVDSKLHVGPTDIPGVRIDIDKLLQDYENEPSAGLAAEEAALSAKKTSGAGLSRKRKPKSASSERERFLDGEPGT